MFRDFQSCPIDSSNRTAPGYRQGRAHAGGLPILALSSPPSSVAALPTMRALSTRILLRPRRSRNRVGGGSDCSPIASSATMQANQLRMSFSAMAYVLVGYLRRVGLRHSQFADAAVATIRLKLLKLVRRCAASVARIHFAIASECPETRTSSTRSYVPGALSTPPEPRTRRTPSLLIAMLTRALMNSLREAERYRCARSANLVRQPANPIAHTATMPDNGRVRRPTRSCLRNPGYTAMNNTLLVCSYCVSDRRQQVGEQDAAGGGSRSNLLMQHMKSMQRGFCGSLEERGRPQYSEA